MKPAIAAGHPLTASVAYEVMKDGGNAIDAAVAAFFMSFLTEPCMSSAGGGSFANIFTKNGEAYFLDFFCQTPMQKRSSKVTSCVPVDLDFGGTTERYYVAHGSSAVPGSIAGAFALQERFGTMPMTELVQPLVAAANQGILVNEFQNYEFRLLQSIIAKSEHGRTLFFDGSDVLKVGQKLSMPGLADFMDYCSKEGPDAFYKGEVAEKLVSAHIENGGHITKKDLENYQPIFRKPFRIPYKKWTILCNPFPAIGGAFLGLFLNHLEARPKADVPYGERYLSQLYDALAYLLPFRENKNMLLDEVGRQWPQHSFIGKKQLWNSKRGSTTHFNVADKWGNAVSLTTSIGEGAGYFLEGTDIQMNNMLGELSLLPNGLNSWKENCRLSSMMTPSVVLDDKGELIMVTGSAGGGRIPTAIGQVIWNILDYDLDVNAAVNGSRAFLGADIFDVEYGLEEASLELSSKEKINIWKQNSMFFGGVHTLFRKGDEWAAAGDLRRDGVVIFDK